VLWQAYELLSGLHENVEGINNAAICRIHSCLMKACQFSASHYIPAGKTRTEMRKTVIVAGAYKIECCPFPNVDAEFEYICRMAKVRRYVLCVTFVVFTPDARVIDFYSNGSSRGGTHSRLPAGCISCSSGAIRLKSVITYLSPCCLLTLLKDGNGRLVRLLASIPLLKHGYPPISVSLKHRADYYTAINKVCTEPQRTQPSLLTENQLIVIFRHMKVTIAL
jgi:hypothetical protein